MTTDHTVRGELVETLRTVACCDYRVGAGDLGLVDSVSVENGAARIEVLPCCTYGMARLEHEIRKAARGVRGISAVEVDVAWDETWNPERMAPSVEDATPDIETLAAEHDIEPRWREYERESTDD